MKPFKVHRCDIPGCWCFTSTVGLPYHGHDREQLRAKARALKKAAKCAEGVRR